MHTNAGFMQPPRAEGLNSLSSQAQLHLSYVDPTDSQSLTVAYQRSEHSLLCM